MSDSTAGSEPAGTYVVVLNPTVARRSGNAELSPRPPTLDRRVVALLDNVKTNADEVLNQIERRLREQYADVEIVRLRKPSASGSAERLLTQEEYRRLVNADVVITALGD